MEKASITSLATSFGLPMCRMFSEMAEEQGMPGFAGDRSFCKYTYMFIHGIMIQYPEQWLQGGYPHYLP